MVPLNVRTFHTVLALAIAVLGGGPAWAQEAEPREGFVAGEPPLHYVEWGDPARPPLVLIHGGRPPWTEWWGVLASFRARVTVALFAFFAVVACTGLLLGWKKHSGGAILPGGGASKVAADVLVQEYGRYFGMKTGCFRGGCLTGPNHSGTALHGFLSYLVKCTMTGEPYTVLGYKGKQVRDNIHSSDAEELGETEKFTAFEIRY